MVLLVLFALAVCAVANPVAAGNPIDYNNTQYFSIQEAIDDAEDGDTIVVNQEVEVNETIAVNKNVTIEGGDDPLVKVTDFSSGGGAPIFDITANGATIDSLVVDTDDDELNAEDPFEFNVAADDVTVSNNEVDRESISGHPSIYVEGDGVSIEKNELNNGPIGGTLGDESVTVRDNTVKNGFEEGIWFVTSDKTDLEITDNNVENYGVEEDAAAVKLTNEPASVNEGDNFAAAVLDSNDVDTVQIDGTVFDDSIKNVDADTYHTSIQRAINGASSGDVISVKAGNYEEDVVVNESVSLEGQEGAQIVGQNSGYGGAVELSTNDVVVDGFEITTNRAAAVHVKSGVSNASVQNNEIVAEDDSTGLLAAGAVSGIDVVNNTFPGDTSRQHVYVNGDKSVGQPSDDVSVKGNDFTGNASLAVGLESTGSEVNANTFDSHVGYAQLEVWEDDVEVSENEFAGTAANRVLLQDGGTTADELVATNDFETAVTNPNETFVWGTIEEALNQAESDDVVNVHTGTYEEHVSVQTPVTLRSESGASNTEIVGRIDVETDNVTVDGFTVRNPGAAPGYGDEIDGIFVGNPNGWDDTDGEVEIRNNVIRDVYGSDKTVEAVHVKHYDEGEPIDGIVIQNNHIENVTQKDAGADGIKLQSDVNNVSVGDNEIRNLSGSWAYGIVLTPSSGESGTPSDVGIQLNTLSDIEAVDYDGVGVGIDGSDGDYASAAEAGIHQNEFHETMDIVVLNKNPEESVYAQLNWWGDADGPTDEDTAGLVVTEPFLTSADAVGEGLETTEFAVSKELPSGVSTLAVPAPAERTVGEMFGGTEGVIYGFEDGKWTMLDDEATLDTLDAVVVSLENDTRVVVEFENDTGGEFAAPEEAELDEGWNFVGAPSYGHLETVFGASSANPQKLIDLFAGPQSSEEVDGVYTFGSDANGPSVGPYKGYFVYAEDDGSVAANGYAGVTAEEALANGLVA